MMIEENRTSRVHLLIKREDYDFLAQMAMDMGFVKHDPQRYTNRRDPVKMGIEEMIMTFARNAEAKNER